MLSIYDFLDAMPDKIVPLNLYNPFPQGRSRENNNRVFLREIFLALTPHYHVIKQRTAKRPQFESIHIACRRVNP